VRLAALAEHRSVGVDDDGRVVEDPLELLLEEGNDEHHLVPPSELPHRRDGRAVGRPCGLQPLRVLLGAEVGAEEDLLQAVISAPRRAASSINSTCVASASSFDRLACA